MACWLAEPTHKTEKSRRNFVCNCIPIIALILLLCPFVNFVEQYKPNMPIGSFDFGKFTAISTYSIVCQEEKETHKQQTIGKQINWKNSVKLWIKSFGTRASSHFCLSIRIQSTMGMSGAGTEANEREREKNKQRTSDNKMADAIDLFPLCRWIGCERCTLNVPSVFDRVEMTAMWWWVSCAMRFIKPHLYWLRCIKVRVKLVRVCDLETIRMIDVGNSAHFQCVKGLIISPASSWHV